MKIRINKGFRGLLSLLVAVMLLVGVMPLSAVQVHATTFTVYFAKDKLFSSRYYTGNVPYIYAWNSSNQSVTGSGGPVPMTYVANSNETYGYHIYKYDFTSSPAGILFSAGANFDWKTTDITGSDLNDGYVYYTNHNGTGSASMPFDHTTLSDLSAELAATTYTLYCAADMASGGRSGWIETKNNNGWSQMDYLGVLCGFNIYRIRLNYTPECLTLGGPNNTNTEKIYPPNIKNNYLYYCKVDSNDNLKVQSFLYEDLTYGALTSSQFSNNMNKDVNVIVDSQGTPAFRQDPERHYVNATMYDYFSDYELLNGRTRTGGNGADVVGGGITVPYGTAWEDPCRRMQHPTFDTQLSNYYRQQNATHPLYFGDIHDEGGGYYFSIYNTNQWHLYYNPSSGQSGNQEYRQLYHDNNSTRRSGLDVTNQDSSAFAATTGLYKTSLSAYDKTAANTVNAARLQLTGGDYAKWFDDTWLSAGSGNTHNSTGKMIGASYDVDFPFWTINMQRKIGNQIYQACDYYYINSEEKQHALRMHKDSQGTYYLKETGQGIYNYSGNDYNILHESAHYNDALSSTYGFFPFNSKQDFYTSGTWSDSGRSGDINDDLRGIMDPPLRLDRTNYCFGTYMVIPFTLTSNNGTVNGTTDATDTPITFSFSGDDDLLVYVDGNLVLDIGGNHGKVQGEINFKERKSWVSNVKSSDGTYESGITWRDPNSNISDERNLVNPNLKTGLQVMTPTPTSGNFVKDLTDIKMVSDSSKNIYDAGEHVMEIFYVERGLFDSNMEIMYNLPVRDDRSFTVQQSIDTSGVNDIFVGENTGDATVKANLAAIEAEMNIQFSQPTKDQDANTDFSKLLEKQDYPGRTPAKYLISGNDDTKPFTNEEGSTTYKARVGNGKKLTYINDFIKSYNYNINLTQSNTFYIKGTALTGSSDLFTTTWTLAKKSGTATAPKSGYGPVTTTSTSSRPVRATKTTSTSAGVDNNSSFDFRGTTQNPDAIVFSNTMRTADLTINKTITDRKPSDTGNPVTFTFKVTFDDVGGIALEDVRGSGGAVTTDRQIQTSVPVTVSANSTTGQVVISGIPVNTKYKIEETGTNNYTPSYTGTINTDWQTLSSNDSANISNAYNTTPPAQTKITLQIQKIWSDSTNMPEQVKFKLQYSEDGGSTWSNVTASSVTNGDVTLTASTASVTNDGQRVVWTMEISGSSIKDITSGGGDIKYRILEYGTDNTIITQTGTDYNENWKVNYNFALGEDTTIMPRNERLGNAKDANNQLLLAVLNTHPTSNPTNPETGGNGIYILTIGGFIAILLAGAGYFIYKKRIFA